jgi:hypothetical protein
VEIVRHGFRGIFVLHARLLGLATCASLLEGFGVVLARQVLQTHQDAYSLDAAGLGGGLRPSPGVWPDPGNLPQEGALFQNLGSLPKS